MFRLAKQIHCDQFCIDRIVTYHHCLGRPREEIDADAAVKLALGFRHKRIPRPNQHINGLHRFRAQCHHCHGLHATDHINFISTSHRHRCNDRGGRLALVRRGARDDTLHPRDFGRQHPHVCRGEQRILPAGHVAAHRVDRNILVPQHDAGQRFNFYIPNRQHLDLGETFDLGLCKTDVFDSLLWQRIDACGNLVGTQTERSRCPFVEFRGVFAYSGFTTFFDVVENCFDGRANIGRNLGLLFGGLSLLEILHHGGFSYVYKLRSLLRSSARIACKNSSTTYCDAVCTANANRNKMMV